MLRFLSFDFSRSSRKSFNSPQYLHRPTSPESTNQKWGGHVWPCVSCSFFLRNVIPAHTAQIVCLGPPLPNSVHLGQPHKAQACHTYWQCPLRPSSLAFLIWPRFRFIVDSTISLPSLPRGTLALLLCDLPLIIVTSNHNISVCQLSTGLNNWTTRYIV